MFVQLFLVGSAIATGIVQFYKSHQPGISVSSSNKNDPRDDSESEGGVEIHEESSHPFFDPKKLDNGLSKTRQINRQLGFSLGITALSAVGRLGHPVFLLCSIPGLLYFNAHFLRRGYQEIKSQKRLGIASIDAVTVTGTFLIQAFFSGALFISLYFLSEKFWQVTEQSTQNDLTRTMAGLPEVVWVSTSVGLDDATSWDDSDLQARTVIQVALPDLAIDDVIVVNTGEVIAVDGTVVAGSAQITCHSLLGSQPDILSSGDRVLASTIVESGTLWIRVQRVREETQIAQVHRFLSQPLSTDQARQSQTWVDKGVLPMFLLGAGTLPFKGLPGSISVLLTYFGYDIRVITPINTRNFIKIALQEGIVVQDSRALEALHSIDTVLIFGSDFEKKTWVYEFSKQDMDLSPGIQTGQNVFQIIDSISERNISEQFVKQSNSLVKCNSVDESKDIIAELHQQGQSICIVNADSATLAMMKDGDVSVSLRDIDDLQAHSVQIYIADGHVERLIRLSELANVQHAHLKKNLWMVAVPSLLCLGGIYFLHFGVLTSVIVDYLGLVAGVTNSMLPSIQYGLENNVKDE